MKSDALPIALLLVASVVSWLAVALVGGWPLIIALLVTGLWLVLVVAGWLEGGE